MRRIHCALGLLLVSCAVSAGARPDDGTVRKALETSYATIARATKGKQAGPIMQLMTEDYKQRGPGGTVKSRADVANDLKGTFAASQSLDMKAVIDRLETKGSAAIATVTWTVKMVTVPAADPNGKTHTVVAKVPLKHTWTKKLQGWRLQQALELPGARLTIDGKPQKINRS